MRRPYSKHGLTTLRRSTEAIGARLLDGRSTLARQLAAWRADLVRDLGGDVSTQQGAIIGLAVATKLMLDSIDAWVLTQPTLINNPPHFTPHGLRHTFASIALQAGQDLYYVSRMLGHADIGLTVATYGSWLNPGRAGALDALDRMSVAPAEAT